MPCQRSIGALWLCKKCILQAFTQKHTQFIDFELPSLLHMFSQRSFVYLTPSFIHVCLLFHYKCDTLTVVVI